jgi:hypothetical protein
MGGKRTRADTGSTQQGRDNDEETIHGITQVG